VHSFRTLLADLATLTRNTVEMPLEGARALTIYARPTAVQQKAFALLGISPERIAVGTPITERPPHRSGRAGLPHPAPTSGV
jgi:hypothetical protein